MKVALPAVVLSFVGAFLLFLVQPMLGKVLLPWFGGAPMVWAACMLAFQALLLFGYWYAHRLSREASQRQANVHVAMLLVSLLFLPVLPGLDAAPQGGWSPLLSIIGLITTSAALPFIVLAATSPLLQRWYVDVYPDRPPWRLYALSNTGSLLALVTYPFLVEPLLDLPQQSMLWSGIYLLYVTGFAYTARRYRAGHYQLQAPKRTSAMGLHTRLRWLLLAAIASAMLLITTTELSQDVAVLPFMWVMPLALFLLTFIIAFDSDRWYRRYPVALLCLLSITALLISDSRAILDFHARIRWQLPLARDLWLFTGLHLSVLFFLCLICHGELARSRPRREQLTTFYLTIATGGALGSLVIAGLMPLLSSRYLEARLALIVAALVAAILSLRCLNWRRPDSKFAGGLVLAVAGIGLTGWVQWQVAITDWPDNNESSWRNFYGVISLRHQDREDPLAHRVTLVHGRIDHGSQLQAAQRGLWATDYFAAGSGLGRTFAWLHEHRSESLNVAIVGLGAGTIAAYGRQGDEFRFYELNPLVEHVARNHFSFLSLSPAQTSVVLGDARLSLAGEVRKDVDFLILDAFNSDAIPLHLLTREAFRIYTKKMATGGIIAIHVSNLHLDLAPMIAATAGELGWRGIELDYDGGEEVYVSGSTWVVLSRDATVLQELTQQASALWLRRDLTGGPVMTDRFSNLFDLLRD